MPTAKSEKIKLMIVIGLSIIFVTMAYFRFWHKKSAAAPDNIVAVSSQPEQAVPQITIDKQADKQNSDGSPEVTLPTVKRDIFRPVNRPTVITNRPKKIKPVKPEPTPVPNFKLGGTVVSDGESIAIINDRFLRTGDTIATFKVVRIENDKVQLASGLKTIELKMINNE